MPSSQSPRRDPEGAQPGVVYLLGAGPGDPELMTVRAARILATADAVLHDELVHPALLGLARPDAVIRHVGKRGGDPKAKQASQDAIEADLVALARSGLSVARLKGGDPFLFGRGSEEAEALVRAGVRFEVVPGVPSPLGASAYAGISLTHRDLASSVTFLSGTTRAGAPFDWSEVAGVRGTVCVLMGMRRIDDVVRGLVDTAKRDPSTEAAIVQWGTRAQQAVVTGPLAEIAVRAREAGLSSPALVIVGPVVALRETLRWFDVLPLFGKRVLLTRPLGQADETARLVRRRGAEPILWPTIELHPPPDPGRVARAVRELALYDVVAFTSENGVARLWRAIDEAGLDVRVFGASRVAAIGSGTAAALEARGIRPDVVPQTFRGEELATAILTDLAARPVVGRTPRILVPRALVAREVLPDQLRAAGCEVDVVPVYETRPVGPERRADLLAHFASGGVDIVLLTSSSTADSLCDLLGDEAAEVLAKTLVASIGPITTATAEKRGLRVGVTATESTALGLLHAVEAHLTKTT